jgi:hypothetical protein
MFDNGFQIALLHYTVITVVALAYNFISIHILIESFKPYEIFNNFIV